MNLNPLEYLILGFLVVMAVGTWVLVNAARHAEDGFETEHGFQVGIAPPVQTLYPLPTYEPATPARASVPQIIPQKPSRRLRSKPPMLPVDLKVADLNPTTQRKSRRARKPADANPAATPETPAPKPGSVDTPSQL